MLHQRYNTGGAIEVTGKDHSITITYRKEAGERTVEIEILSPEVRT
jgi:hypothetical protein